MSDHSIWCAATGCPMHGTMSSSAKGGGQYYCFLHFGCEPERVHVITDELHRLKWLVQITQRVRHSNGDLRSWVDVQEDSNKQIALAQSKHLLRGDNESLPAWLARLEETLHVACTEAHPQQPLNV